MSEQDREAHRLAREFLDEEYRRSWAEDYVNTSLALQIAALRGERHWKQSDLAAKAGTTQSAISRMEDVEYGAHSIRVLKQLAAAFGLRLRVSFEEFGTLISESAKFSEDGLHRRSFDSDPVIARLLAEQGLALPVADGNGDGAVEDELTDEPPVAGQHYRFEDEFEAALAMPLEDRVQVFKKWLKGYGLPSDEEPAYKRLYFSIPADGRYGEWSRRVAEACAEWLRPETFGELLSDPDDGERAVMNLLRLSAALPAGRAEIVGACEELLPGLGDDWKFLNANVQEAIVDLVSELREVRLAKYMFGWPRESKLSDRHRLKISSQFFKQNRRERVVILNLASSLEAEALRSTANVLVRETSDQIIRYVNDPLREANLKKSANERAEIALFILNQLQAA